MTDLRPAALLLIGLLAAAEPPVVAVAVSGDGLEINGTSVVPRGMFGVHNSPLSDAEADELGVDSVRVINRKPGVPLIPTGTSERIGGNGRRIVEGLPRAADPVVDCLYDRYQPAMQLVHADWRERLTALGTAYGEQTRASGRRHLIEFWNEPYLNWATLPGVNYLAQYYHADDPTPGGPMRLRTTGEVVPELVWDRQIWAALDPATGQVDAVSTGRIPRDAKAGQTVQLRFRPERITIEDGATYEFPPFGKRILRQVWIGRDTTQKHYWSGSYNLRLYIDQYRAFAEALKRADPAVELAAGWGLNIHNEGWDSWRMLYRPTIDALHPLMDGLHEHHYGGDTRLVAAGYEVAYAYALANHGRRLRFWNTEAGGHLDPEQPGNAKPANEGSPAVRATAAMTYLLRDVIHLLALMPDKAYTRAAHHPHENGGDFIALRMLRPLRGRLLACTSDDAAVWPVASIAGDRLCLAVFNDRRDARRLHLRVQAPGDAVITGASRRAHAPAMRTRSDGEQEAIIRFEESPLAMEPGRSWTGDIAVPGTGAVVLVFALDRTTTPVATSRWSQHVTGEILQQAAPSAVLTVDVPTAALEAATAARLRLVANPIDGLACSVNGHAVTLPAGVAWTVDLPIPTGILAPSNRIVLTAPGGASATIATASLLLQHP